MAYTDPNTVQDPTSGERILSAWGDVVRDDLEDHEGRIATADEALRAGAVDVKAIGAAALDGTTDDTAAIQAVIDTYGGAYVPKGSARIDGTLTLSGRQLLILHTKAELRRVEAAAATDPILQFVGNHARQKGRGLIVTEKASSLGIVHFGPLLASTNMNVLWSRCDARIAGVEANGNIGVRFNSSTSGSGFGTYANEAWGHVEDVGTAVQMVGEANANAVHLDYHRIGQYVIEAEDVVEFGSIGGFVHNSPDVTILKWTDCTYGSVVGLRAEPGGNSKPYEFVGCTGCYVQMTNNTALEGTDDGVDNTFVLRDKILSASVMDEVLGISATQFPTAWVSWNNITQDSGSFSAALNSAGGTIDASIAYDVRIRPGTYRLDLCHYAGSNRGIYTVEIASVAESGSVGSYTTLATINGYAASSTHLRSSATGLAITGLGRKRLRLRMATKDASSSSYVGAFEFLSMTRTGP